MEDTHNFLTADEQFLTELPAELKINAPWPTRTQAGSFRTSAGLPGLVEPQLQKRASRTASSEAVRQTSSPLRC